MDIGKISWDGEINGGVDILVSGRDPSAIPSPSSSSLLQSCDTGKLVLIKLVRVFFCPSVSGVYRVKMNVINTFESLHGFLCQKILVKLLKNHTSIINPSHSRHVESQIS